MKINLKFVFAFLAVTAAAIAAPLTATTAIHTKPDESSPVVTFLKAGSEPVVVHEALANSPAGWLAVEVPGPIEGYVANRDIMKTLDVKVGAAVHLAPKAESGVLTTIEPGEKTEISGLHGKWTQIKLTKRLTGYIHLGGTPGYVPPIATTPASSAVPPPLAPAPVSATAYGVTAAGKAAPMELNAGNNALPRLFQGRFVSTRSAFKPRRPYDWAVNDDSGKRFAYLDLSKLLLTEQIESYVDHMVVVYGAARPLPGGKEMVIEVESLQLR
jgi:hypothetical protein